MTPTWFQNYLAALTPEERLGLPAGRPRVEDVPDVAYNAGPRPPIPPWIRVGVIERDRYCARCGEAPITAEIDHIVPWARGGSHGSSNLRLLCRSCNQRRGAEFTVLDEDLRAPIAWDCPDEWGIRDEWDRDEDEVVETFELLACYCLHGGHKSATRADRLCEAVKGWDAVPPQWRNVDPEGRALDEVHARSQTTGYEELQRPFLGGYGDQPCPHGADAPRLCALCRRGVPPEEPA
jgi:hypothetical protein